MTIAIVGLGYVGLPLALQFARNGVTVVGLDIDQAKVSEVNAGRSYIKHIEGAAIAQQVSCRDGCARRTISSIVREVEAVIICVPTPLNKNREPDISFILKTGRAIAPHLRRARWSCWNRRPIPARPTKTCAKCSKPVRDSRRARIFIWRSRRSAKIPAIPTARSPTFPRWSAATRRPACDKAMALYGRAIKTLVPVSSCRVAEATKLLENIFRGVNIALVNELKVVYAAMGIDVWEVIEAAKTKPFGFMPFYPGPGLGGHCIPIDPFYLTWKAREYGQNTRFIELAGEINTAMPDYVVGRVAEALNDQGKPLKRLADSAARPGLQGQRGRRPRVAQLCPDRKA